MSRSSGRGREQLVLRVHQLAAAAEAGHRAGEQPERALLQLLRVEPDAVEERELQLARAVGDDDLEPLLRAAAVRSFPRLAGDGPADHAGRGDLGEHGDVVVLPQRVERGQLAPGVVAAGVVAQQVTDRAQAEDLLERVGGPLAQRLDQRIAERGHEASIGAPADIRDTRCVRGRTAPGDGRPSLGRTGPILDVSGGWFARAAGLQVCSAGCLWFVLAFRSPLRPRR